MKVVWKFPLRLVGRTQSIEMPADAFPIHFGMQHGNPTLWAIVDPVRPVEMRDFAIVGTGHEVPEPSCYQGTIAEREFIWHLFEVTRV